MLLVKTLQANVLLQLALIIFLVGAEAVALNMLLQLQITECATEPELAQMLFSPVQEQVLLLRAVEVLDAKQIALLEN